VDRLFEMPRRMPQGRIRSRKEQRGTEGLPLFDATRTHEDEQEKAQGEMWTNARHKEGMPRDPRN